MCYAGSGSDPVRGPCHQGPPDIGPSQLSHWLCWRMFVTVFFGGWSISIGGNFSNILHSRSSFLFELQLDMRDGDSGGGPPDILDLHHKAVRLLLLQPHPDPRLSGKDAAVATENAHQRRSPVTDPLFEEIHRSGVEYEGKKDGDAGSRNNIKNILKKNVAVTGMKFSPTLKQGSGPCMRRLPSP